MKLSLLSRYLPQALNIFIIILSVTSTSLTITLLLSGTRLTPCSHAGCTTISGLSEALLSFHAPSTGLTVDFHNGTIIPYEPDFSWYVTWHLSATAAHADMIITSEDGPFVVTRSPLSGFDAVKALQKTEDYFEMLVKREYAGLRDDDLEQPETATSGDVNVSWETGGRVKIDRISMILPCVMWIVQLVCANLGMLAVVWGDCCIAPRAKDEPTDQRRRRSMLRRRVIVAALFTTAFGAGCVLAIYISVYVVWAAGKLEHGENAMHVDVVKVGSRALGMLWGEFAALAFVAGLGWWRWYMVKVERLHDDEMKVVEN